MAKLEKEESGLVIDELAHLATHGHNSSLHGRTGMCPSNGPGDGLVSMSFPTALMQNLPQLLEPLLRKGQFSNCVRHEGGAIPWLIFFT